MLLLALLAVPFVAALVSVLARTRRAMETANLAGFGVTFALALMVVSAVLARGPVSVWGGFLYADSLSALVCLLTASVALLCAVYAVGYVREDERSGLFEDAAAGLWQFRKYYSLTPLFVCAMLLVALANNLGVMWVAIEGTTLTSVFLVMFYGKVTSLEAAWKYAIIGGVGLSMALFGTLLAYYSAHRLAGSDTLAGLNWSVLAAHAAELDRTTMRLAFILVLVGYGTKAGLAPMHTWKPDAYSEAPVPAAALLSSALLNCALYGLIRFYILASRCLGAEFPGALLVLLGVLSMGIATPFILLQRNLRRLLAYSSIDQAGIMAIALGLGSKLGALALMLHMTFHSVTKPLLFLCAGNVHQHFKTDLFGKIKGGVLRTMPLTGGVFLMATLAVLGMPPFSMFQSEFLLVRAALGGGHYLATALFVLFGAGIFGGAMFHVGGLVLGAGDGQPAVALRPWRDLSMLALAGVLVMLAFWLPAPLLELIRGAARVITGD
ncbi:MAG: hydrogenase 4 subunit F [Acidobacteriia bacterium]|nr:hydrogenase 4 subunit F [Terriglobia bacterium]